MKIQLVDLQRQYQKYKQDIDRQIEEVLESSVYIMGSKVRELEEKLADFVGTPFAVGCASGTDALMLALMAYGVKAGDEIITTPFTFIATAEVMPCLGAKPVFVDIREDTCNIDPQKIKDSITENTKGIIAVNIFGQPADYDEINKIAKEHGLFVIEDAAQSLGAKYKDKNSGSLADMGCVSFFPAKPLGCYGDGGMVFTKDEEKAKLLQSFRVHGKGKDKYDNVRLGYNSRLDTLQAGVLLAKLNHFQEEITQRINLAQQYSAGLKELVVTPKILESNVSSFCHYCIRVPDRENLQKHLKNLGISTAVYYPKPLHLQQVFSYLGYKRGDFPISEKVAGDILALPMHPFLSNEEQEHVINNINSYYA